MKGPPKTEKTLHASTPLIPAPEEEKPDHNHAGPETDKPTPEDCHCEDTDQDPQSQTQQLHTTVSQMRDSLSLLEVELTEMREQVLTHITISTDSQLLEDQLSQVRNQVKISMRTMKEEVKHLQQDQEELKRELAELKQRVNAEISRGCALLPNVHLAHYPTIGHWDLYDHVHLDEAAVREFTKTLKDVALGRHPGHSPSSKRVTSNFQHRPAAVPNIPPHHRRLRPIAPNKAPGYHLHLARQPNPPGFTTPTKHLTAPTKHLTTPTKHLTTPTKHLTASKQASPDPSRITHPRTPPHSRTHAAMLKPLEALTLTLTQGTLNTWVRSSGYSCTSVQN
ncbi:hypothetical protein SKAU_G00077240 [Synaphobranchus kaupii]|uniref:Uncharacterized protein n=1 Tax=Synaphobranchus kaupii TaxID=118154 RepID=A0A9Q1JA42_SYNKA|nr:hypothetical protein SKAU_G00077240 [Synaphobranchus kaupii]